MGAPVTTYHGSDAVWTVKGRTAPLFAVVNASSAGANTIVAAVAGKKILVQLYLAVATTAVNVSWESSGGNILDGPVPCGATGGVMGNFSPVGHFITESGEGLVLYLSGAVQVGGHVQYVLI
jgi:hypothetical protein